VPIIAFTLLKEGENIELHQIIRFSPFAKDESYDFYRGDYFEAKIVILTFQSQVLYSYRQFRCLNNRVELARGRNTILYISERKTG
jgi:hypothetical protein